MKHFLLMSNLNLLLAQLKAIFSCPFADCEEEADPCLAIVTLQVVMESGKVSPEPAFLQNKPELLHLLLIKLTLLTLHQLLCPLWAGPSRQFLTQ